MSVVLVGDTHAGVVLINLATHANANRGNCDKQNYPIQFPGIFQTLEHVFIDLRPSDVFADIFHRLFPKENTVILPV
jgi:hypothetical protein